MAIAAALLTQCAAGVEAIDGAHNPIRSLLGDISAIGCRIVASRSGVKSACNTAPLPPGTTESSTLSKVTTTSSTETAAGRAAPEMDPELASPTITTFVGFLTDGETAWSQGFELPATGLMLCLEEDRGRGPGKFWAAYCLALELGTDLGTEAAPLICELMGTAGAEGPFGVTAREGTFEVMTTKGAFGVIVGEGPLGVTA